jgi:UDP-N-acetylglucosamine:LPS N-acetylglucosamine transferase
MAARRVLLLSASMGDGHDAVAGELGRRLSERGDTVRTVDMLACLPLGFGTAIRGFYSGMLRFAPWLYDYIWHHVVDTPPGKTISPDPVERVALPKVRAAIADFRPDAVVPTFHIAAQVAGRLRAGGDLAAPVTVLVTELVVHRSWIHAANDRHLCVHPVAAAEAAERAARDALSAAPVVNRRYYARPPDAGLPTDVKERVGGRIPILVTAGAWGAGGVAATADVIAGTGRYAAVVLCGRNDRLQSRLAGSAGVVPLPWRDDVPRLLTGSAAVIQNGGGLACWEALALGRPVVTFQPLPGHGEAAAARLADLGLAPWARTQADLVAALDRATATADPPRLDLASLPDPADLVLTR